jgi:hypothetical protein
MRRAHWAALVAAVAACGSQGRGGQRELTLRLEPEVGSTRLVLLAAPGLEINARLAPALELERGPVVRFHASRLSPDSALFAEPPEARLVGPPGPLRGTLRASVCSPGERVCRLIAVEVRGKT